MTEAPQDVAFGLELVVTHCRTRERQEAALAALDFKLDVLWSLLDTIHYHYVVLADRPDVASAANRGEPGADRLVETGPAPVGAR
jgi:pyrroloquinoline-quinone synthase